MAEQRFTPSFTRSHRQRRPRVRPTFHPNAVSRSSPATPGSTAVSAVEDEDLQADATSIQQEAVDNTDLKIAASEARTDTKFAKLEGQLALIAQRLDSLDSKAADARSEARTTRRTVIGTGISLGGLILAMAAFGVNSFNLGSKIDDIARVEAQRVVQQSETSRPLVTATTAPPANGLPSPDPSSSARP